MNINTIKTIELILNEGYDKKDPYNTNIPYFDREGLLTVDANHVIINKNGSANYIYFLLMGKVYVLNDIEWSTNDLIDILNPLDILGLIECLNNQEKYTSFVVAKSKCILYRMNANIFLDIIKNNSSLCYKTLFLLGKIASDNMSRAETKSIFHPRDALGHYFYLQAKDKLPYTCPFTRNDLSEKLHINLRTLYRYISYMKDNEYLDLKKGKIFIDERNLKKLYSRYGDVVL